MMMKQNVTTEMPIYYEKIWEIKVEEAEDKS